MSRLTYLVVGGSSGIGLATAKKIAEAGNRLVLVSSSYEKLKNAVLELPGEDHLLFPYDLNDIENIEDIFKFCYENDIKLSGLIYCAGISPLCLLADNNPELMEKTFHINVFSMIECIRCFYKEKYSYDGSKIVAISSITAHASGYRQILYGASKAAMIAAVKLMAKELLNRNIKINCISPGVTDTSMLDELRQHSANLDDKIRASQPLGIIPPEKVADLAWMLLSQISDYLTGTEIVYDGGALLK